MLSQKAKAPDYAIKKAVLLIELKYFLAGMDDRLRVD